MKIIPLTALEKACVFSELKETWPNGIPVSQESLDKAIELDFDLHWFAVEILNQVERKKYSEISLPARNLFYEICDKAWEEHTEACIQAYEKSNNKTISWEEYIKIQTQAEENYNRICGQTLLMILSQSQSLPEKGETND